MSAEMEALKPRNARETRGMHSLDLVAVKASVFTDT